MEDTEHTYAPNTFRVFREIRVPITGRFGHPHRTHETLVIRFCQPEDLWTPLVLG